MPGGVLATSGEVGKASEEACGVLTVSNKIAPAAPKRRARGGKASRARRLENFRQHKAAAPAAAPAIKWEQLAHGLLRQQRATLRDGARAAWVRMRAARAKIGAAVRSAWRCRSLEITGIYIERDGVRQYVTGEKVAPLSRRDVYILSRAADRVDRGGAGTTSGSKSSTPRVTAIGFAWRRMTVPRTGCTRSAPCKPSRTASTRPTRMSARPTRTTAGPRTNPTTTMVTTA